MYCIIFVCIACSLVRLFFCFYKFLNFANTFFINRMPSFSLTVSACSSMHLCFLLLNEHFSKL